MTEAIPEPPAEVTAPVQTTLKTVYLIRHAESLENQRISSMLTCFGDLGRFSLPKKSDVAATCGLLNVHANADAPISPMGLQQCEIMQEKLVKADFLRTEKVELVVHSPLERARQTCQELLGCSSKGAETDSSSAENKASPLSVVASKAEDDTDADTETITFSTEAETEKAAPKDTKEISDSGAPIATVKTSNSENSVPPITSALPEPVQRVVNLDFLSEKTHKEWLPGQSGIFENRVAAFQKWLAEQPESVVCVVGHSQFFKQLLGLPFKFDNVDVYQATFDAQKETPNETIIMEHNGTADEVVLMPQWFDLKLRFSCRGHPNHAPVLPAGDTKDAPKDETAASDDDI